MLNDENNTELHKAVLENRYDTLQSLLYSGKIERDERNKYGETALFLSLKNRCNVEITSALIDHGCNVNIPDKKGVAPVHLAAENNSSFLLQKLIENGADVNVKESNYLTGYTPLHYAAMAGNLKNVRVLIENYATVNERDSMMRRTPIFWAISNKKDEVAAYLVDYVVDINDRDYKGMSLLHCALFSNSKIILEIIERGGDVNLLYGGRHCVYLALEAGCSSSVFETIWSRIDYELLLAKVHGDRSFLETFICHARFPDEEFSRCLRMVCESPYIKDFLREFASSKEETSLIYLVTVNRDVRLGERLQIINTLLLCGAEVYYNDVSSMYAKYGFDEGVQLLLTSGRYLNCNTIDTIRLNLVVNRICYDYFVSWEFMLAEENDRKNYQRFYNVGKPSLSEISRDVVRRIIYKNWSTPHSFEVYQAFSKLNVPSHIKDVLYLKAPIYNTIEDNK